jgi:membrane-bound inhibitor of C-type lysozyme
MRAQLLTLNLAVALPLLALTACSQPLPSTRPAPGTAMACAPSQLELRLANDGRFNGMSHSGTLLIVRNTGATACPLAALPTVKFADRQRQTLAIVASPSEAGVLAPLALPPKSTATSEMRWVSGNVYAGGHCESPATIAVAAGPASVAAPFEGQLCGAAGKPPTYVMTPFHIDPAPAAPVELTYRCDDGRTVRAAYPDIRTAVLGFDGETHRLHIAVSADGARYVGAGWQWWSKGMHDAWLAPLQGAEQIASAAGVACRAP